MKAKKENKLGSAADGECTDLNGIGDDEHDSHDDNHEDFLRTMVVIDDSRADDRNCRRELRHK